jgi:hypothetical protein
MRLRRKCKEVRVSRIGDKSGLEPMDTARTMPGDVIDALGDRQFVPDGREQPVMLSKQIIFDQ